MGPALEPQRFDEAARRHVAEVHLRADLDRIVGAEQVIDHDGAGFPCKALPRESREHEVGEERNAVGPHRRFDQTRVLPPSLYRSGQLSHSSPFGA